MTIKHRNPFVFVIGCPRSGTTLMQRMLDAHPDLTVANDTHFITRAAKRELRKVADPKFSTQLMEQVESYHRFRRLGLEHEDVVQAAQGAEQYSDFVRRLYDLRGAKMGKLLSGEKTPDYCRRIPVLHQLFPQARFIHVIRDGRDTALSALQWATAGKGPGRWSLWQEDAVGTCALWWRWQAGTGWNDGHALGKAHYMEVKYEALVREPDVELQKVCSYLHIPYSEQMARFHEGKTIKNPGLSAKSAWLGPTPGLRDWRRDMDAGDVAVFDAIAGKLLDKTGYKCRKYSKIQSVNQRVDRCLEWWSDNGRRNKG